jgi:hypothetical protein
MRSGGTTARQPVLSSIGCACRGSEVNSITHLARAPEVRPSGLSGDSQRDTLLKIREKRQLGRYIIPLDLSDLREVAGGEVDIAAMVERKYTDLVMRI